MQNIFVIANPRTGLAITSLALGEYEVKAPCAWCFFGNGGADPNHLEPGLARLKGVG